MLGRPDFLVFIIISIAAAGMMQFYFLGTAQFMQDNGIATNNVPASMAVAQAMQAGATLAVLSPLVGSVGFKWTLTIGTLAWLIMYAIYVAPRPPWAIVASQAFHGLAYVFFIIAGQMFAGAVAPKGAEASTQALAVTAQSGVGLFLGTQLAGIVMDRYRVDGRFQWRQLWIVPGAIMLVCVLALILLFRAVV